MKTQHFVVGLFLCLFFSVVSYCQTPIVDDHDIEGHTHTFDGYAPYGICEDHFHAKNSLMVNYKFMPMWMDGLLNSSDKISTDEILQDYMISPLSMRMDMHMYGIMYGLSNKITVMLMGNYISNSMDLQMRNGNTFSTSSNGLSDHTISALYNLGSSDKYSLHGIIGLSFPIGSNDVFGTTPMSDNTPLAYPMVLGSGTFDPYLGLNYLVQLDNLLIGNQVKYKTRIGDNSNGYSFGDELKYNLWIAYPMLNRSSISLRAYFYSIGSINGENTDYNKNMMPLFDAENSGRQEIDLSIAYNFKILPLKINNLEIGIEAGIPLYQNVNGVQMKNQYFTTLGLRYTLTSKTCH